VHLVTLVLPLHLLLMRTNVRSTNAISQLMEPILAQTLRMRFAPMKTNVLPDSVKSMTPCVLQEFVIKTVYVHHVQILETQVDARQGLTVKPMVLASKSVWQFQIVSLGKIVTWT
jgi:hypothetical protein